MRRMKRSKVYCSGCAYLLLLPGTPPQCVATAEFVDGPLRSRIDVRGRVPAEKRNLKNDCGWREGVSLRAYRLKRWILWRMNNEGKNNEVQEASLRDYSVSKEGDRSKAYRGEETRTESVDELILAIEEDDSREEATAQEGDEDLLTDGGIGDRDGGSADDQGGGNDEHPKPVGGLERKCGNKNDGGSDD